MAGDSNLVFIINELDKAAFRQRKWKSGRCTSDTSGQSWIYR